MARNISFATGEKEYIVNGDESKVIRINVADVNMLARYEQARERFKQIQSEFGDDPSPADLIKADEMVRGLINDIFDADVCTPAFGGTNCLSPVSSGKTLYQSFLDAFLPEVKKDIEAAVNAAQIRLEAKAKTFTEQLSPKPKHDVTGLTDDDIARIAAAIKAGS